MNIMVRNMRNNGRKADDSCGLTKIGWRNDETTG